MDDKKAFDIAGKVINGFLFALSLPELIMMILLIIGLVNVMIFLLAAGPYLILYHVVGMSKGFSFAIEAVWLIILVVSLGLMVYGLIDLIEKRKDRKDRERQDREIARWEYEMTRIRIEIAKDYDDRRIPLEMGGDAQLIE